MLKIYFTDGTEEIVEHGNWTNVKDGVLRVYNSKPSMKEYPCSKYDYELLCSYALHSVKKWKYFES